MSSYASAVYRTLVGAILACLVPLALAQQDLVETARVAAEAASSAARAADAAAKAAREARDAADSAAVAAAAAAKALVDAGIVKPVAAASAGASAPTAGSAAASDQKPPPWNPLGSVTASSDGGGATIKLLRHANRKQGSDDHLISLSSPVSKDSRFTEPANLDGLASGASLAYTYGKYWPIGKDDDERMILLGGTARFGYTKYSYFDPTTLAQQSADRYAKSLAPYFGVQPAVNWLLIGKFDYQRAYRNADTKVMCPEAQEEFPNTCVIGSIGAPPELTKRVFSLTTRHTSELLDFDATLSYDRVSRVKAIDVPMYFIKSGPEGKTPVPFNAGIRLGWRSDTKDPMIGIFVGSPFSFWTP